MSERDYWLVDHLNVNAAVLEVFSFWWLRRKFYVGLALGLAVGLLLKLTSS